MPLFGNYIRYFCHIEIEHHMNNKKKHGYPEKWGYGSVSYEDCWSLNTKLAGIIAEHLHAFLNAEKYSTGAGFSSGILQKCGGDEKMAMKMWIDIIRKMFYAFENYRLYVYPHENNRTGVIVDKERIKEGMQLFVEYFDDLWI